MQPLLNTKQLTLTTDITEIVANLLNSSYLHSVKEQRRDNIMKQKEEFNGFHDLHIIYYYLHDERTMNRKRSEDTIREYAADIMRFYQFLCSNYDFGQNMLVLKQLNQLHIEAYIEHLGKGYVLKSGKKRLYKATTLSRKIVIIKSFLKYLFERKYIDAMVHVSIKPVSITEKELPNRDLHYDEVKQLVDYYRDAPLHYALLITLATTGLRIRELSNAKWNDVSIHNGEYWLRVDTKGSKEREVLIFKYVFDAWCELRNIREMPSIIDHADDSHIFVSYNHKPYSYNYLSKFVSKIIKRTGFNFLQANNRNGKLSPHYFRHFFAIYSMENGATPVQIQRTLGHSSYTTTQIYLKRKLNKSENAAQSWNKGEF